MPDSYWMMLNVKSSVAAHKVRTPTRLPNPPATENMRGLASFLAVAQTRPLSG